MRVHSIVRQWECQITRSSPLGEPLIALRLYVEFGYLPVFTYWMQSPWFLKDEPSARSRSFQPPDLQLFLSLVAAASPRWTLLTVQNPASSAMTKGIAPTCHVGCAATNAAQFAKLSDPTKIWHVESLIASTRPAPLLQ